ncbi:hypothetical protein [Pseudoroseicyclus sp. CXY001]|uniref:hypothetical protein n=1 Tax=Pseudoroseicyclus sp. CXY001 TaxID=3242492 RepID=UPI003571659D
MVSRSGQMAGLAALADARFRAEQGRLAVLRRKQAALEAQIAELSRARAGAAALPLDDPATRTGADLKWQAWVARRITALNMELARLRAEIEVERARLAKLFGQSVAASRLGRRLALEESRLQETRAEREGR